MKKETSAALKALFCSLYPQTHRDYFRFFHNVTAEELDGLPALSLSLDDFLSKKGWMDKIHYSWFLPFLESIPGESLPYLMALFPKESKKELKKMFSVEQEKTSDFPDFLLSLMKEKIYPKDIVPYDLLSKTEMSSLFLLSKKELVLVVDLLGIYDLAHEMRQIVDKSLIQKIHNALGKEERAFLEIALKQPVRWVPPKLNLASWDGDVRKVKNLLHYRGLYRMAMATYNEEKAFQWHLSHQFDIGRGKVLVKFYATESELSLLPYFKQQTLDIIKRFGR